MHARELEQLLQGAAACSRGADEAKKNVVGVYTASIGHAHGDVPKDGLRALLQGHVGQ